MKITKQRRPPLTSRPTAIPCRRELALRARESRLIHRMARNSPSDNRRLGQEIARQRPGLRPSLGVVRRDARRIARWRPAEQQALRQRQDSPRYVGLGAASALPRDDPAATDDREDLDGLWGSEVLGDE